MQRVIRVLSLDLKMKGFFKGIFISLLVLLGFLTVTIEGEILFLHFPKDLIKNLPAQFVSIIPYIILVFCSISLTKEFENKTDKFIFTGIFSRTEIIISKLMSVIVCGLVCYAVYVLTLILFQQFNLKASVNNLIAFVIYSFVIGSFTLLISAITSNAIITGLIIYALHFDLILALLGQALESTKSMLVKGFIENSTFYIANTGLKIGMYTLHQSLIMIFAGLLALMATFVIINIRDV